MTERNASKPGLLWMIARRPKTVVLTLTVVALVIRLLAAPAAGGLARAPKGDENTYVRLAQSLATGHGYADEDGSPHSNRAPGLPILLSFVKRVSGDHVAIERVAMCLLAAALVPVCFGLGRFVGDDRAGILAAAAAAVFPNWVYYSTSLLSDLPAALATGIACALLCTGARRGKIGWFVGGGVVAGFSILIRASALANGLAVLAWIVAVVPTWRRRLLFALAVGAGVIVVLAPWTIRNAVALDRFVLVASQGGVTLWVGSHEKATGILGPDYRYFQEVHKERFPSSAYANDVDRAAAFKAEAKRLIREDPMRYMRLCLVRFGQFWKVYSPRVPLLESAMMVASMGIALPFFLVQAARRGWRQKPDLLFLGIIVMQTAVHMAFAANVRYRIPIEPLVIAMAAAGAVWILDRRKPHSADEIR